MKIKTELFNDNFQNYKRYGIPKAQLVIADIPYNLGKNAYASSTEWYIDGDNKNGATMTEESQLRENTWLKYGCNAYDGKEPKSTPISFWLEQDIFQYIQLHNLSIASCYGEIIEGDQLEGQTVLDGCMSHLTTSKCKRTGCMFCMFGVHLEKEPNRFQMMKETHPKQYDYCINKLGLGKVLDYIGVKY